MEPTVRNLEGGYLLTNRRGGRFRAASAGAPTLVHRCSYINNASGAFYYLCGVLDGYSRSVVHWDLLESMTEAEI